MIASRYFGLLVFSAAILLCMVREWNAPVACPRALLNPEVQVSTR